MKARHIAAISVAVALAAAGCGGSSSGSTASGGETSSSPSGTVAATTPAASPDTGSSSGGDDATSASGTLTVWLQVDAQSGWPKVVAAATDAFHKKYPNVKVDVQYQQWGDHLTKLDATLTAGNAPDVVEFGNTETTKYMAEGALVDLSGDTSMFDNSTTWLDGLAKSCTYEGKTYCVPYYASSRAITYRTDMFKKAGITAPPTSLAELDTMCKKLMDTYGDDPNFSALYLPGKNWYAAMSFVYGKAGAIATKSGDQWQPGLSSAKAQAGLKEWLKIYQDCSRAAPNIDEAHPQQYTVMAKGKVAMMWGLGWEYASVTAPKDSGGNPGLKGKLAVFPMPGYQAGKQLPAFLGGSDLGIPVSSKHQDWAKAWIAAFTSTPVQTKLVKTAGLIPNTTSLLKLLTSPSDKAFAKAASTSWFVPTSPNWADVENQSVLTTMLSSIASGKSSVADATKSADQKLDTILNKAS